MQSRGRLIENEQISNRFSISTLSLGRRALATAEPVQGGSGLDIFRFSQVSNQFQPLRFTAAECVERLTEPKITQSNFLKHFQPPGNLYTWVDPHAALRVRLPRDRDQGGALRGLS